MKKYITFLLGAFLLPSCEYRQENVFDKTPAERTADKLNENKKVLEYDDIGCCLVIQRYIDKVWKQLIMYTEG